jgi:hypothetical protein
MGSKTLTIDFEIDERLNQDSVDVVMDAALHAARVVHKRLLIGLERYGDLDLKDFGGRDVDDEIEQERDDIFTYESIKRVKERRGG